MGLACVQERSLPQSFVGPSELALSLEITAVPDVLPLDGHARSVVSVHARDERARPIAGLALTLRIMASDRLQDYGTLSERSVTTGADGRAAFTYTAPRAPEDPAGRTDSETNVSIRVTPRTGDHANALGRSVRIRLVPAGRAVPPFRVAAGFTFAPVPVTARETTLFRAPYCDVTGGSPPTCVDDPRRLVERFAWSFGDGSRGTGRSATHVFAAPGSYPVRLTVTDALDRSASETLPVRVEEGTVPAPAFDVSPAAPLAGSPVVLDAGRTTSARPVVSYAWTLGDGATGRGRVLTHRYEREGVYTVNLTATDDRGGSATASGEVAVEGGEPSAVIDVSPEHPAVGQTVAFSALRSGARPGRRLVAWAWTFGDAGASARGVRVTHAYPAAGTYVVTLVVTDDRGATGTARATLTVEGAQE